jgi:hypothetical protein
VCTARSAWEDSIKYSALNLAIRICSIRNARRSNSHPSRAVEAKCASSASSSPVRGAQENIHDICKETRCQNSKSVMNAVGGLFHLLSATATSQLVLERRRPHQDSPPSHRFINPACSSRIGGVLVGEFKRWGWGSSCACHRS